MVISEQFMELIDVLRNALAPDGGSSLTMEHDVSFDFNAVAALASSIPVLDPETASFLHH